jgi:hypothetical protein
MLGLIKFGGYAVIVLLTIIVIVGTARAVQNAEDRRARKLKQWDREDKIAEWQAQASIDDLRRMRDRMTAAIDRRMDDIDAEPAQQPDGRLRPPRQRGSLDQ